MADAARCRGRMLRARAATDLKPVRLCCSSCSRTFYFDYIWELCHRMEFHAGWYSRYLRSPARLQIINELESSLCASLKGTGAGEQLTLEWRECFTCEFEHAVRVRAQEELAALRAVAKKLEPLPSQAAETAVEFGVLRAQQFKLPLSPHASPTRNATFSGLGLVVTIWPKALGGQPLTVQELEALHSAPYGAHATSTVLHPLTFERASVQADGCPFDGALYLLAEPDAYEDLKMQRHAPHEVRLQTLKRACLSGKVEFLASTHFDGLKLGGESAVDRAALQREEEEVGLGPDDGSDSGNSEEEHEKERSSSSSSSRWWSLSANRSAAGRSGRWWSVSGLRHNPTARMAVNASQEHANHFLVVAPTTGKLDTALLCYTSRAGARALTERDGDGTTFRLRGDDKPSLPRMFQETPGRKFLYLGHRQNKELQRESKRASTVRAVTVATSRVRLLLFLASIGLVPPPPRPRSTEIEEPELGNSRDGRAAKRARNKGPEGCWPSFGAALTARLTWEAFERSLTREGALRCLACLKGYYLNLFPSPLHRDSDNNLESWTIRLIEELLKEQAGASSAGASSSSAAASSAAASSAGAANAGATVLPLRGLALFTRPDRDVAHAFFKFEEHGAWDCGGVHGLRGGTDGWATGFHLQSGGASQKRLLAVLAWYQSLSV